MDLFLSTLFLSGFWIILSFGVPKIAILPNTLDTKLTGASLGFANDLLFGRMSTSPLEDRFGSTLTRPLSFDTIGGKFHLGCGHGYLFLDTKGTSYLEFHAGCLVGFEGHALVAHEDRYSTRVALLLSNVSVPWSITHTALGAVIGRELVLLLFTHHAPVTSGIVHANSLSFVKDKVLASPKTTIGKGF